ncbi:hypothetical protein E2C01_018025 [Portunus trituberculatus]|uniref:Uncharacterized protein n=1 Tax=Portunus trituberculatus TaxID=210409 RepID=A0A5B7DU00_PORTR|nr:hypothetical protein [Portunus trituberculatus]
MPLPPTSVTASTAATPPTPKAIQGQQPMEIQRGEKIAAALPCLRPATACGLPLAGCFQNHPRITIALQYLPLRLLVMAALTLTRYGSERGVGVHSGV